MDLDTIIRIIKKIQITNRQLQETSSKVVLNLKEKCYASIQENNEVTINTLGVNKFVIVGATETIHAKKGLEELTGVMQG